MQQKLYADQDYLKLKQEHPQLTPWLTLEEIKTIYPEFQTIKKIAEIEYTGASQGKGNHLKLIRQLKEIETQLIVAQQARSLPAYLLYLYYQEERSYQDIAQHILNFKNWETAKHIMEKLGIPLLTRKDSMNRKKIATARAERLLSAYENYLEHTPPQKITKNFRSPALAGIRKDTGIDQPLLSIWEANLARIFLFENLNCNYRTSKFKLTAPEKYKSFIKSNYIFFLPDFEVNNVYYDIVTNKNKEEKELKIELFKEQYPEKELIIIDVETYKKLERIYRYLINDDPRFDGWEENGHK